MAKESLFTRDELLSGEHFRTHPVEVGGKILNLRELTAEEWMQLSKEENEVNAVSKEEGQPDNTLDLHFDRVAKLVCKTAVNKEGQRILSDDDFGAIRQKLGARTLMEVYRTLAKLGQDTALGG